MKAYSLHFQFLFFMTVLMATLSSHIGGGDSGELINVGFNLGVAHPPGYPIFTLLAKLFAGIPLGSIAWRINLFSAVCGAGAALVLSKTVEEWLDSNILGFFVGSVFLFSLPAWQYSIVTEVFALNALVVAAAIFFSWRYFNSPNLILAIAIGICTAVAVGHHHTYFLFAPVQLIFILLASTSRLGYSKALKFAALSFLVSTLGFLPYVYLYFASQKHLPISWGDLGTFKALIAHFLRIDYGTFQLVTTGSPQVNKIENIFYFFKNIPISMNPFAVLCIGPGLIFGFFLKQKQRTFFLSIVAGLICYLAAFHYLSNMALSERLYYDVQSRFWILPYLALAFLAPLPLHWILNRWQSNFVRRILTGIVILSVSFSIFINYGRLERTDLFEKISVEQINLLPPNSILLTVDDVVNNSFHYAQSVLKMRPDIKIIFAPILYFPWAIPMIHSNFPDIKFVGQNSRPQTTFGRDEILEKFLAENIDSVPIFFHNIPEYFDEGPRAQFALVPLGLFSRVVRTGTKLSFLEYQTEFARFQFSGLLNPTQHREGTWQNFLQLLHVNNQANAAILFAKIAQQSQCSIALSKAEEVLQRLSQFPVLVPNYFKAVDQLRRFPTGLQLDPNNCPEAQIVF